MTVQELISQISIRQNIPESEIVCYQNDELILPFVKICQFTVVDAVYSTRFAGPQIASSPGSGCIDVHTFDVNDQLRIYETIVRRRSLQKQEVLAPEPSLSKRSEPCPPGVVRTIVCKVNGMSARMMLDTGASVSVLHRNQARACGSKT
jgi:hypothetical protein